MKVFAVLFMVLMACWAVPIDVPNMGTGMGMGMGIGGMRNRRETTEELINSFLPSEISASDLLGKPQTKPNPVFGTKPDIIPVVKPETKPVVVPDTKPVENPEIKPDMKPVESPEIKPELKPEMKPEEKSDTKPEIKPENKQDIKNETPATDGDKDKDMPKVLPTSTPESDHKSIDHPHTRMTHVNIEDGESKKPVISEVTTKVPAHKHSNHDDDCDDKDHHHHHNKQAGQHGRNSEHKFKQAKADKIKPNPILEVDAKQNSELEKTPPVDRKPVSEKQQMEAEKVIGELRSMGDGHMMRRRSADGYGATRSVVVRSSGYSSSAPVRSLSEYGSTRVLSSEYSEPASRTAIISSDSSDYSAPATRTVAISSDYSTGTLSRSSGYGRALRVSTGYSAPAVRESSEYSAPALTESLEYSAPAVRESPEYPAPAIRESSEYSAPAPVVLVKESSGYSSPTRSISYGRAVREDLGYGSQDEELVDVVPAVRESFQLSTPVRSSPLKFAVRNRQVISEFEAPVVKSIPTVLKSSDYDSAPVVKSIPTVLKSSDYDSAPVVKSIPTVLKSSDYDSAPVVKSIPTVLKSSDYDSAPVVKSIPTVLKSSDYDSAPVVKSIPTVLKSSSYDSAPVVKSIPTVLKSSDYDLAPIRSAIIHRSAPIRISSERYKRDTEPITHGHSEVSHFPKRTPVMKPVTKIVGEPKPPVEPMMM